MDGSFSQNAYGVGKGGKGKRGWSLSPFPFNLFPAQKGLDHWSLFTVH